MPKYNKWNFVIFFILFINIVFVQAQTRSEKIDELIKSYYDLNSFNGTVLVADDGKVIFKKAYGYMDFESDMPAAVNTRFPIYSISKQFTSLLIMQLVEKGKISLQGKLSEYYPEYRKDTGSRITVHHLLTHTHGITPPDWKKIPPEKIFSFKQLILDKFSNDLEFEPGTDFHYGIGHIILAGIVEEITGKSFKTVMKENILDPVGMSNTGFIEDETHIANLAASYKKEDGKILQRPGRDLSQTIGASGMYSTVEDLYKWDQALYGNKILTQKYIEKMFIPHNPQWNRPYGYGWDIRELSFGEKTKKIVMHDGGTVTRIIRAIDDKHLIILLGNILFGNNNSEIALKILNEFYDLPK
ncbi:serine hydrolase domain-containing protein [candidate division KSB1 bacterium]